MTRLAWMAGGSAAVWVAVTTLSQAPVNPEALFGMLGPLAASLVTWALVERVHVAAPERVMNVLMQAFMAKVLFFGLYIVVMLRVVGVRTMPFAISFTGYFIGLYVMQALFLRRLR
jgi:hypothetical protein